MKPDTQGAAAAKSRELRRLERERKNLLAEQARSKFREGAVEEAYTVFRQLSKSRDASFSDLAGLFNVISLRNPELLERWLRRLRRRHLQGTLDVTDYARLLAAVGLLEEAKRALAAVPPAKWPQQVVQVMLRSQVMQREFPEVRRTLATWPEAQERFADPIRHLVYQAEGISRRLGSTDGTDDLRIKALERLFYLSEPARNRYRADAKKLLILVKALAVGGAEKESILLAKHMRALRPDVEVLVGYKTLIDSTLLDEEGDCGITCLEGWDDEHDVPPGAVYDESELLELSEFLGVPFLPRTLGGIWHHKAWAVHVGNDELLEPLLAAVMLGLPSVTARLAGLHLAFRSREPSAQSVLLSAVYRFLARFENVAFAAITQAVRQSWSVATSIPQNRFQLVYSPHDFSGPQPRVSKQERAAFRQKLGIPANAAVVGGVFRMSRGKDPLLWVEAAAKIAARVPDAFFLLIGDGPLAPAVRERAAKRGLSSRLCMPGFVGGSLQRHYEAMDVFMLTSQTEGLALAIAEAQAHGVAVVATNAGGVIEALAFSGSGKLVEDRSPASLAREVIRFLNDIPQREKIAKEAPGIICQRFAPKAVIQAYDECRRWNA